MRLSTFNALNARSPSDRRVDLDRFGAAVAALDADVLALQEVDYGQARSHGADLARVAAEASGAPHVLYAAALTGTPGRRWAVADALARDRPSYGIALLSRYPVLRWRELHLPRIQPWFPLWVPGPEHLMMIRDEPRLAVVAEIEAPLGPVVVVATHLTFVPGWNRRQLRMITADLAGVPDPVVIMGDLNLMGEVPARITGCRPLVRRPTYPANRPNRQLDHILLRGTLGAVRGSGASRLSVSDHRALWVDLSDTEPDDPAASPVTSATTSTA